MILDLLAACTIFLAFVVLTPLAILLWLEIFKPRK